MLQGTPRSPPRSNRVSSPQMTYFTAVPCDLTLLFGEKEQAGEVGLSSPFIEALPPAQPTGSQGSSAFSILFTVPGLRPPHSPASCAIGVGRRCGSDPALLWLWCRLFLKPAICGGIRWVHGEAEKERQWPSLHKHTERVWPTRCHKVTKINARASTDGNFVQ